MIIQVNPQPNLFLEAADLICAYVNGMDPKCLTAEGAACVPAKEMGRIMETVCGDLDVTSSMVRFYFHGYRLDEGEPNENRLVCIGNILANSCMVLDNDGTRSARELLRQCYLATGKPYRLNSFSKAGFGWDSCAEFCPISEELDKLAIPDALRLRLAEVLSNYSRYAEYLCDLLEPVVERLRPLLTPWIQKLQPQTEQWICALKEEEKLQNFLSRFNADLEEVSRIVMCPRVLFPGDCNGYYSSDGTLFCYAGAGLRIGQAKKPELAPSELTALRLLAGADRIDMLRVMVGKRMGARELARKLNVNPGTVFRDLNSLNHAHLVKIVSEEGGRAYITDLDFLKQTVRRLVEYIESGE